MSRRVPSPPSCSRPLDRYRDRIARCVRCGTCRTVCPSFLPDREESFSPRGRMALVEAVMKGKLSSGAIYRDRLATCTGCLACETACPSGVPVTEVLQAAKEEAVRGSGAGIITRVISAALADERLMRSLAWFAPIALHYSGKSVRGKNRGAGSRVKGQGEEQGQEEKKCQGARHRGQGEGKARGRVVFFPGCAIGHFQRDIGRASVNVLRSLGYDVIVPGGLECCGRPHLSLGDRASAEACARRNNDILASVEADAVVTACASCGLTFKKEYPTLLAPSGRRPAPVLDIHEFLAGKLGGAAFAANVPGKATWHDPCHLGRGQGLFRTARTVLRSIPGIELVEMEAPDRCCGFGGIMRISRHGLSDRIGDAKSADIIATGASLVVTGCPGCRMQIADSLRRAGSEAVVVHTVQVIAEAMRIAGIHDPHPCPSPLEGEGKRERGLFQRGLRNEPQEAADRT